MQCPNCGANYGQEDLFCGECGRPLSTEPPPGGPSGPPHGQDRATAAHKSAGRPPISAPASPRPQASFSKLPLVLGVVLVLLLCLGVGAAVLVSSIAKESRVTSSGPVPAQAELLYQDDFRDPASGWDTWEDGGTSGKYIDGEYRLAVHLKDYMVWSYPEDSREFRDFAIEVDARQVDGSLDSTFGLIVRHQSDEERYYWFQISGGGYYSVEKKWDGEWILLQEWESSDAIKQGLDATNHIEVLCYGDRFRFSVNDTLLTELTDDTLSAGNIGLAAGAYDEPPVVVLFDNLSVYALDD
jgi:hypothetical protein